MHRRIFCTRTFTRWMRKVGLVDRALIEAVTEMAHGLVDADLGGHLLKKRIALPGAGKRGGVRTIVATRMRDRWFFLYGFQKSERDNISTDELKALQEIGTEFLALSEQRLAQAVAGGAIVEIKHGHDET